MKNLKSSVILGINPTHNSSAAIMIDGKIVAAVGEERFLRVKNTQSLPVKSINYCLAQTGLRIGDISSVVIPAKGDMPFYLSILADSDIKKSGELSALNDIFRFLRYQVLHTAAYYFPNLGYLDYALSLFLNHLVGPQFRENYKKLLSDYCLIDPAKIAYVNHHEAHAAAAYFGSGFAKKNLKTLIFTADGGGGDLSATIYRAKGNKLRLISKTPIHTSLAQMYMFTTFHLGLKPVEDEYKVMGLAPYAPYQKVNELTSELLRFLNIDKKTLRFKSRATTNIFHKFMPDLYRGRRFDVIAGAIQKFAETRICEWVNLALLRYRISSLTAGGGIFANVKINQKIAEMEQVKNVFFAPSPGDETNSIGACYWHFSELYPDRIPEPLGNLYLGPSASDSEIEKVIVKAKKRGFRVSKPKSINETAARYLSEGKIVARFAGRLEFGARALGNRSILADASRPEVKDEINRVIKSRDFWMPFAPSILETYQDRYLVNPKKLESPYMMAAFETTDAGARDLAAAIHPYDKTARAQIVKKGDNPGYFDLLERFYKLTGRAGFLNTSFNLHGEPIVCTPQDALNTFSKSGLKFMQLEKFMIEK